MLKRICAVVLAALLCVALGGCGCSNSGAITEEPAGFAGYWRLTSAVTDGEELTADDLAEMGEYGSYVLLALNEDGTATMSVLGEEVEGTWTTEDDVEGTLSFDEDVALSVDDNTLTLTDGDDTMTFARIDEASYLAALGGVDEAAS